MGGQVLILDNWFSDFVTKIFKGCFDVNLTDIREQFELTSQITVVFRTEIWGEKNSFDALKLV